MTGTMDAEEITWARECAAAGDTIFEIAEAAGRRLREIRAALSGLKPMTDCQREIASLYAAGLTVVEIEAAIGASPLNGGCYARRTLHGLRDRGYPIPYREAAQPADVPAALDALKRRLGVDTDADLGRRLGLHHAVAGKWRSRRRLSRAALDLLNALEAA